MKKKTFKTIIGLSACILALPLITSVIAKLGIKEDKEPTETEVYLVGDFNDWNYEDRTYKLEFLGNDDYVSD